MIWIICNANKPYDMQHFKNAAISLSIDLKVIDPTKLVVINKSEITLYYDNEKIDNPSYVLNWNGCNNGKLEAQLETALKKLNVVILNSVDEIELIQDKFKWQLSTNLQTTHSLKVHSSSLLSSIDLIEENFSYPFVLKSDTGSLGLGVYKIDNHNSLIQIIELITLLDKSFKVHIEEFIDYEKDIRMYIIGDSYYLMQRIAKNDFRANVAKNAKPVFIEKTKLTDDIFTLVRKEYKSLVLGVDILLTNNNFYICEINSAPSFKGLKQVHDIDIAKEILQKII